MNAREVGKIFSVLNKSIKNLELKINGMDGGKLLNYVEAAEKVGIKERKLSALVNEGSLEEGFHFLRIGSSIRFPMNVANLFYQKPPRPPSSSVISQEPCATIHTVSPKSRKGAAHLTRTDSKSQFNLHY